LGAGNTNPQDIATDGTTVWVVHSGSPDRIFVYRASDGAALGNWTIDPANATPTGLTLDLTGASNSLWTVDSGTDRVYEYANARSILSGAQTASLSFALNTAGGNTSAQGIADPRQGASSLVTNQSTPHSATVGVGWSVLGFRRYWNCWGSY
jgi:6-phosphogluconolactonase (cycloisomerase 2 family)